MLPIKNIYFYLFLFSLIIIANYYGSKIKTLFEKEEKTEEYNLIKNYLLNDSPLYGFNKPKLWIHTKYELNSRKWKDFYSRNSTDLNQPYIHLTIKTIIDHCADDFHICLIDDESFSRLIPSWDVYLPSIAEPMKTHFRELAFTQILYYYGGMFVPNSFVCNKNLLPLYLDGIRMKTPFICESVNHNENKAKHHIRLNFIPSIYFMGAEKNHPVILEFVEFIKKRNRFPHFTSENDFLGDISEWCIDSIRNGNMKLIDGSLIGIKNDKRKSISIEELTEEDYLHLDDSCYGVYIPSDEFLNRTKYQWFAVMSSQELLASKMIISSYIKSSMVDSYKKQVPVIASHDGSSSATKIKSIIAL